MKRRCVVRVKMSCGCTAGAGWHPGSTLPGGNVVWLLRLTGSLLVSQPEPPKLPCATRKTTIERSGSDEKSGRKLSEQPTRKFLETVSCSCLRSKVCHNLLQNRKKNQAYLNYDYLICVNLIISHKWWSPWGNDLRKETVQLKCRSDRCDALAKWLSDNLFARELLWIPCGWFRKCFTIHYDM